jgi:hypothetical protein
MYVHGDVLLQEIAMLQKQLAELDQQLRLAQQQPQPLLPAAAVGEFTDV